MYAILRSIPRKLGGVVALLMSVGILYFLPLFLFPIVRSRGFNPLCQLVFWVLVASFMVLMWIGSKPVEAPYELVGQVFTVLYFSLFVFLYGAQQLVLVG